MHLPALILLVLALIFPTALRSHASAACGIISELQEAGCTSPSEPIAGGTPQLTPAATERPQNSVASLRQQGITPAVLLAGDLLLLIVALVIVLIQAVRERPRRRE